MTNRNDYQRRPSISLRTLLTAAVTTLVLLALPAGVASAHTSFEQSSPADGETISEPLGVITLQFSGETEYGDDGFTILTPDGTVRTPTSVSSLDQKVFELTFAPPLAGGEVGVRWSVNAPDAHSIDGAFSFNVTAPATAQTQAGDLEPTAGAAVNDSVAPSAPEDPSDAMTMTDSAMDMTGASPSLDEFLADPPARGGEGTARWGRLIGFSAIALIIGGLAFAVTTLRGRRAEIDRSIAVLRILGATLTVGALVEYVGIARIADASIVGYWSSQPGMATMLRAAGGLAVVVGLNAVTAPVRSPLPAHSLSSAVNSTMAYELEERAFWSDDHDHRRGRYDDRPAVGDVDPMSPVDSGPIDPLLRRHREPTAQTSSPNSSSGRITVTTTPTLRRDQPVERRDDVTPGRVDKRRTEPPVIRQWVLDRSSTAASVGVAVAVVSFWFDGHTVSKGIRPLHAIVNSVHVVAGSVWVGGVVAMAVVLWTRHRSGVAPRALEMVVRFSGVATLALGAVIAAGGLMAILVLDSVGELFTTQWGRILLLKSAAAALAMVGGAYNHFRLIPALEADPDDPRIVEHLRSAVTAEAMMLGFVIVVTASLVSAAS